tara:strand:- start:1166 stop:2245 length:1080 start_codon:yes stop_codon:yes gene_type:complete
MINHRITKLLKIILFFSVYILLIGNILADSYFTVENIEIKLDFDTDRDIRNLAIEEAQTKAIIELSEKLLSPNDYQIFKKNINKESFSYLVESIEFIDEVITEDFYRGVFNINFNPYKVREYYTSRSFIFSEVKSKEMKVFINFDQKESFFILNNIWNTKWSETQNTENNLNLYINTLNDSYFDDLSLDSFLSGDFDHSELIKDFSNIIFIWCEPKLISEGNIQFEIISKIIINNKNTILRSTYVEEYNIYKDNMLDSTINDLKQEILQHWVKVTSQEVDKFKYKFNFNFNSLKEWVSLKNSLEKIGLISNYRILSFNLNNIEGIIEFHGDNNKFELILSQNNIQSVNLGEYYNIQVLK